MIVDTHVHPLSDDPVRYPTAPPPGPDWYAGMHLTAEECIEQMAIARVDQMVLVSAYSLYAYDNSYAADAAAAHPDRFVGVCRIDPLAPDAPEVLSGWVDRGIRGVRLGSAEPGAYAVWERARQLGIPVAVQVSREHLGQVRQLAKRFPDVNVILDHLAHPSVQDGPPYRQASDFFALRDLPNLYLKFSSMNLREAAEGQSTTRAFIEALVEHFGPSYLLWGSDFPHTRGSAWAPYKDLVDLARTSLAFLPAADREQMLAGTAHKLYPTLATAA
jgi:L-fuconolactonase